MVGLVLVSHSRSLAQSVEELVRSMTGPNLPLAIAAGVGENHAELGTDAVDISEAILSVRGADGVVVLMDMGSALLSAETALDLLEEAMRENVHFCPAPFVEGAVAAGVTAHLGAPIEDVCREALASLQPKQAALGPPASVEEKNLKPEVVAGPHARHTVRLQIRHEHGLHARPAARLISKARPFQAEITVRNLTNERGPVSIRSLSRLASLEILRDHEIEVAASGEDAEAALATLARFIRSGLGNPIPPRDASALSEAPPSTPAAEQTKTDGGFPAGEGIALGPAHYFQETVFDLPQTKIEDVPAEIERLRKAVALTQANLERRRGHMSESVGAANADIYEAQILALQDPELMEGAIARIQAEKDNAAKAWSSANEEIVSRYKALQDPYLRRRAADWQDVSREVIELLTVRKPPNLTLTRPAILIADDLTPQQISNLPRNLVLGVILLDGAPTAHSSILLRALAIPTVVQARAALEGVDWDRLGVVALDGGTGKIWLNPEASLVAELEQKQARARQWNEEEARAAAEPGMTLDGERIETLANLGQASEVEAALQSGAEGVGLLRTEFLFLARDSAPTETEQIEALEAIAQKMQGKPIIVRTLDVGGDKALPYLPMPREANPFLGVRAIRLCFARKALFITQLRAILRAGYGHDFRIMFPMIAGISDLLEAKEHLAAAHGELAAEKIPHLWPVPTGIMIEIPSAALQAEALAEQVDFFSIGTNDLTQYTLAADRGNPALAAYHDALHPAVLALVDRVVRGAGKHHRKVAVCGEAASDAVAAALFIGLGVRELSMTGVNLGRIKAMLRKRKLSDLQTLGQKALRCVSAAEVRARFMTDFNSSLPMMG